LLLSLFLIKKKGFFIIQIPKTMGDLCPTNGACGTKRHKNRIEAIYTSYWKALQRSKIAQVREMGACDERLGYTKPEFKIPFYPLNDTSVELGGIVIGSNSYFPPFVLNSYNFPPMVEFQMPNLFRAYADVLLPNMIAYAHKLTQTDGDQKEVLMKLKPQIDMAHVKAVMDALFENAKTWPKTKNDVSEIELHDPNEIRVSSFENASNYSVVFHFSPLEEEITTCVEYRAEENADWETIDESPYESISIEFPHFMALSPQNAVALWNVVFDCVWDMFVDFIQNEPHLRSGFETIPHL
jgi:hypothetical protein